MQTYLIYLQQLRSSDKYINSKYKQHNFRKYSEATFEATHLGEIYAYTTEDQNMLQ